MSTRVGTCSLCGGDVMGVRGAWMSILPPPPDTCAECGAVAAGQNDVIPMVQRPRRARGYRSIRYSNTTGDPNEFDTSNDLKLRGDSGEPF
jgi:hypothetical protein